MLLKSSAYQLTGFWALMFLLACLYIFIIVLTYKHLVVKDFYCWVSGNKLEKDEAKSLGLLIAFVWPLYWASLLVVIVMIWLVKSIIALFKILFLS